MTSASGSGGIEQRFDREKYRDRLRDMCNKRLRKEGRAIRQMMKASLEPVRQDFFDQLEECKDEWRRRHPRPEVQPGKPAPFREAR